MKQAVVDDTFAVDIRGGNQEAFVFIDDIYTEYRSVLSICNFIRNVVVSLTSDIGLVRQVPEKKRQISKKCLIGIYG